MIWSSISTFLSKSNDALKHRLWCNAHDSLLKSDIEVADMVHNEPILDKIIDFGMHNVQSVRQQHRDGFRANFSVGTQELIFVEEGPARDR